LWREASSRSSSRRFRQSTVGGRRSRNFAGGGERGGLGDIQNDAELSAALESLAEARRSSFENRFQTGAACALWLGDGATVGDEGQAVGHGEDEVGAVHGGRWRVRGGC